MLSSPALALACALSGSCSFLINTSEQQCASDADCQIRGLAGSACVANVCQAIVPAAGNGSIQSPVEATAGTMSDASTPTDPDAAEPSGEAGAGGSIATAGAQAAAGAQSRAGAGGAAGAGAGGSMGGAGSMSSATVECEKDEDCTERVGTGGTCVDQKCFAPPAECETDEECLMKGPEYEGGRCADKKCLPNPRWRCEPPPPASPTEKIELTLPIIDALQLAPLPNVPVVACNKLDYMCMQPIAMATTGSDGRAKLSVPANFAGYMQQNERRDYTPGLYFMPSTIPDDKVLRNFPVISSALTGGLAIPLGTSLDSTRGHIMLIAEDCAGVAVPGVEFSSPAADMRTVRFYIRDQVPSATAKDTPADGTGGFVNLPEGNIEISAKHLPSGVMIANITVIIRRGYISAAYIRPILRGATITGVFPTGGSP